MMVMGTVDFMIVTIVTIGLILLMLNCGLAVMAKQQLAFAANAGAEYAAEHYAEGNVSGRTQAAVIDILRRMRRNTSNTFVTVRASTFADQVAWIVTVTDRTSAIIPGQWMPSPQRISDTGVALQNSKILLGVSDSPYHPDNIYRPAPTRTLWLPVVHPPRGLRPGYRYEVLIGNSLCTHGMTPCRSSIGFAAAAGSLHQVGANDPR